MDRLKSVASAVRRVYERFARRFEQGVIVLEHRYTPLGRFQPGPFEGWSFLWKPALIGFVAMSMILAGGSFTNSPFKLNMANTWFFGDPSQGAVGPQSETRIMFAIVLVYGGLFLLMRVWLRLAEVMKLHPGVSLNKLWWMLLLWATPMIVSPPMFSRDVFSYAAQGEMTSHHLSPYILGPFSMGSSPYVNPVDPLWGNAPAPYGPFFLFIDGTINKITRHHQLATVVGLRLLEVLAVVMIGVGVAMLASSLKRDPGEAFVLSALNPLVLLTIVGSAHNDGLMAGFLVLGVAFAIRKKMVWAVALCACAAAIKAPAAIGLAFVAWTWLGEQASVRERIKPILKSVALTAVVLGVWTWCAGFGFGWVNNLLSNGTVRSWAAPMTALGMATGNLLHSVGLTGISVTSTISVWRFIGLLSAVGFMVWMLLHGEKRGWVRSLALVLVLFVELGPVVQPWYLAWGLVLMAASYKGREHFWLLFLSITGPFIGLPGGRQLLADLVHSNPLVIAAAVVIVAGMLVMPMGRWTQWSWPENKIELDA